MEDRKREFVYFPVIAVLSSLIFATLSSLSRAIGEQAEVVGFLLNLAVFLVSFPVAAQFYLRPRRVMPIWGVVAIVFGTNLALVPAWSAIEFALVPYNNYRILLWVTGIYALVCSPFACVLTLVIGRRNRAVVAS